MKKIVCSIAIIAALGIASASYAQKLMLGPIGGIDIATVAWDSAAQFAKKGTSNGLIAGGQLDVWFNDHVALSTGLLLDQKGWSEVAPYESSYYTLDYIEIPIFLKVAFGTGNFQPYVFAGPSIGFMVLGYTNQVQTDGRNTFNNIFNIDNVLNTIDFSVVGGAGVAYNLPSGIQFFVDAGYAYGLVNILNEKDPNYDSDYSNLLGLYSPVGAFKTRDIRIAGGILFPI